ncbi:MAG: PQQ-binding-like beta-propeller repeat protein [Chloroflexia bacterium]|nr:PQQ-binding-like beta-propeller repeat protein [Chloroflexia bacterium]
MSTPLRRMATRGVRIVSTVAVAAALVPALVLAQTADDTATFHGDLGRTGAQPGPAPSGDPTLAWRFATQGAVRAAPVVAGGVLYVGSNDGSLYALDSESGEERWRFPTDGPINGSAAVVDGSVYFASGDGYAYAVNAESGEQRWRYYAGELNPDIETLPAEEQDRGAITTSVMVVDGLVYVSSNSFKITAIDAETGIERWHDFSNKSDVTTPSFGDGALYFSSDAGIFSRDAQTGAVRWTAYLDAELAETQAERQSESARPTPDPATQTAAAEETIAAGGVVEETATETPAADATETADVGSEGLADIGTTPTLLEVVEIYSDFTWDVASAPVVVGDLIYQTAYAIQGDDAGSVISTLLLVLSAEDGSLVDIWSFYAWDLTLTTPAIVDGSAYVATDEGLVYAYDTEQRLQRWGVHTESYIGSSPVVSDDAVFFGNDNGTIYALAAEGGQELWRFQTGGAVRSSAVVLNGLLYIGSDDGSVYAIGGS